MLTGRLYVAGALALSLFACWRCCKSVRLLSHSSPAFAPWGVLYIVIVCVRVYIILYNSRRCLGFNVPGVSRKPPKRAILQGEDSKIEVLKRKNKKKRCFLRIFRKIINKKLVCTGILSYLCNVKQREGLTKQRYHLYCTTSIFDLLIHDPSGRPEVK